MRNIIARVLQAIAAALRGTWKAVYSAGRWTVQWIQETALPAVAEVLDVGVHTIVLTAKAVPNLIARVTPAPVFSAPPAAGAAAAPLAVQRDARQALLDAAADQDARRGLAISVRAGARALLREQDPVAVPAPVLAWMRSLGDERLATLAAMSVERILATLDGLPTALGADSYQASKWAAPAPAQAIPDAYAGARGAMVEDFESHLARRIRSRLVSRADALQAVFR